MNDRYHYLAIETFGRDCMGNIMGYRVVARGERGLYLPLATHCGDIYKPGSFAEAHKACVADLIGFASRPIG